MDKNRIFDQPNSPPFIQPQMQMDEKRAKESIDKETQIKNLVQHTLSAHQVEEIKKKTNNVCSIIRASL